MTSARCALGSILASALLPSGAIAQPVPTVPAPVLVRAGSAWTRSVVAELPAGSGERALGVFSGAEDEQPRGPNVLVAEKSGRLLVLDGENQRTVLLQGSRVVRTRPLERARHLTDAAHLGDGRVVAFDANVGRLWMIDDDGEAAPIPTDQRIEGFRGLHVVARRVTLKTEDRDLDLAVDRLPRRVRSLRPPPPTRVAPPSRPIALEKVRRRGIALDDQRAVETAIERGNAVVREVRRDRVRRSVALPAPVSGPVASVTQVGSDSSGRTFLRVEVLARTDPLEVRRFIRILDRDLRVLHTFEYPVQDVIVPMKDVDVDAQGNVYVMLPYRDRVQILRYAAP